MSAMRIAVSESEGMTLYFTSDENLPFEILHPRSINECIFFLSWKLTNIVRGVSLGAALPELSIPFFQRNGSCLELCLPDAVPGSALRMEFREFPAASYLLGWRHTSEHHKLLNTATMQPHQLADMLHHVLSTLLRSRFAELYDNDRSLLTEALNAIRIYETEGRNLQWKLAEAA